MTDLESIKGMLDRGGWEYTERVALNDYIIDGDFKCYANQPIIYLIIEGPFYDELNMQFVEKTGQLVQMSSHVAYNGPACDAAREVYSIKKRFREPKPPPKPLPPPKPRPPFDISMLEGKQLKKLNGDDYSRLMTLFDESEYLDLEYPAEVVATGYTFEWKRDKLDDKYMLRVLYENGFYEDKRD